MKGKGTAPAVEKIRALGVKHAGAADADVAVSEKQSLRRNFVHLNMSSKVKPVSAAKDESE
jgi:hypothetical protein